MIPWYVSYADVQKHPSYGNGGTLESILFAYGMDVKKGYTDDSRWQLESNNIEDVDEFGYWHRSLSGERVKCPRFVGMARSDGGWSKFINRFLNLPVEFTRSTNK